MGEVNWIVSIIVGTILAIPIGFIVSIVANLVTPLAQNWLDRRAVSIRGKRLETLKKDYERVKDLHDNPASLYLTVIRSSILALGSMAIFMMVFTALSFWFLLARLAETIPIRLETIFMVANAALAVLCILSYIIAGLTFGRLRDLSQDLARLFKFEKYEADIVARIKNLEDDSPDDRDLPQPNES